MDKAGDDPSELDDPTEKALEKAIQEVRDAEAEVVRSEDHLVEADKHLEEVEEHLHEHHEEPLVTFEDVNESETVAFRAPWATKLTEAWSEASKLLQIDRTPKQRLQTPGGLDLTPYLDFSLKDLEEQKIVTALTFLIASPTGGA